MGKDKRSRLQIWSANLKRLYMWHFKNKKLGLVLVTEFPKSGGTWFCQMLEQATGIPFPRNVSPNFEEAIMHGHNIYHKNYGKVICILRDGRDIMVSAYFHFLFENDRNPSFSVKNYRSKMPFDDYENVEKNMPEFIKYMFNGYAAKWNHSSWSQVVNASVDNSNVCIVKYEELLSDAPSAMDRAIRFVGKTPVSREKLQAVVDDFSFKKLTKRKPGDENKKSFLRKGIAGDWKNYFNQESIDLFKKLAGAELIKAGYEKNMDWK